VVAVGLVGLGRLFIVGGGPILPVPPTTTLGDATVATTTSLPGTTLSVGPVTVVGSGSFDPFGEGGENDEAIGNVLDGSASTTWRSERYQDPLSLQKPGVGLRFEVTGTPSNAQLVGLSTGTEFGLYWAPDPAPEIESWERVMAATAQPSATLFTLPPREGGHWLLWMTDFPQQPDGTYYAELAEVRFTP